MCNVLFICTRTYCVSVIDMHFLNTGYIINGDLYTGNVYREDVATLPTLAQLKKQTETVHWDTFMEKKLKKKNDHKQGSNSRHLG